MHFRRIGHRTGVSFNNTLAAKATHTCRSRKEQRNGEPLRGRPLPLCERGCESTGLRLHRPDGGAGAHLASCWERALDGTREGTAGGPHHGPAVPVRLLLGPLPAGRAAGTGRSSGSEQNREELGLPGGPAGPRGAGGRMQGGRRD